MVVWCDPDDETVIYWSHKGLKAKPEDIFKADIDALILAYEKLQSGKATEVIRCKDCKWKELCEKVSEYKGANGYCSRAERKTDEKDTDTI